MILFEMVLDELTLELRSCLLPLLLCDFEQVIEGVWVVVVTVDSGDNSGMAMSGSDDGSGLMMLLVVW
jgi:hypothetical protein